MTTPVTQIDEHERALDYLYGMLEGEEKTRFEAHLASCARCQAELESFGKVREAARVALPLEEPSERLTGALHAQLMHEASQRASGGGGKILPFVRRFVRAPGYAVAASVLIIGGALGVQWSRGRLFMPTAAPVTTAAPVAAPTKQGAPVPEPDVTPTATPTEADKKEAPEGGLVEKSFDRISPAKTAARDENLRAAPPKPSPGRMASPYGAGGPDLYKSKDANGFGKSAGDLDSLDDLTSPDDKRRAKQPVARHESPVTKADTYAEQPAPAEKKIVGAQQQNKLAEREEAASRALAAAPAATAPAPAPASIVDAPVAEYQSAVGGVGVAGNASPSAHHASRQASGYGNAAPADGTANRKAEPDTIDSDRQRANALARAGRYDEAVSLYAALDRRAPQRLDGQDRFLYARCRRMLGQLDLAQSELSRAKRSKQLAAPALDAEQQALSAQQRQTTAVKAAKSKGSPQNADELPAQQQ